MEEREDTIFESQLWSSLGVVYTILFLTYLAAVLLVMGAVGEFLYSNWKWKLLYPATLAFMSAFGFVFLRNAYENCRMVVRIELSDEAFTAVGIFLQKTVVRLEEIIEIDENRIVADSTFKKTTLHIGRVQRFGELYEGLLPKCPNLKMVKLDRIPSDPRIWQKVPDLKVINDAIRRARSASGVY